MLKHLQWLFSQIGNICIIEILHNLGGITILIDIHTNCGSIFRGKVLNGLKNKQTKKHDLNFIQIKPATYIQNGIRIFAIFRVKRNENQCSTGRQYISTTILSSHSAEQYTVAMLEALCTLFCLMFVFINRIYGKINIIKLHSSLVHRYKVIICLHSG